MYNNNHTLVIIILPILYTHSLYLTHYEYVVQEHGKDGALSQLLRVTLQIAKDEFDSGHQAVHDIGSGWYVESCLCAMGEGAWTFLLVSQCLLLQQSLLHHCLFDIGTTITNVLRMVGTYMYMVEREDDRLLGSLEIRS